MLKLETSKVDLKRALRLLMRDHNGSSFFVHPYLLPTKKSHSEKWFDSLSSQLSSGVFKPSQSKSIAVPKPDYHVRPGTQLELDDELVYTHVVLSGIESLRGELTWSDSLGIRMSNLLGDTQEEWFREPVRGWSKFRQDSNRLIDQGYTYVIFADIAGYYENIDLGILARDVTSLGFPASSAEVLSNLLNTWAGPRQRGIPQGFGASDVLGEVYLCSVDRRLKSGGVVHLRYLDDFRLFARSETDVRKAFLELQSLLRTRGLNLQSSKTAMLVGDAIKRKLNVATDIIEGINRKIHRERFEVIEAEYGQDEPQCVGSPENVDVNKPSREIVVRVWREFQNNLLGAPRFDKSIFHYVTNRLAEHGLSDAIEYCIRTVVQRPEETKHILKYLLRVCADGDAVFDRLVEAVFHPDVLFDYQRYLVLRSYFESDIRSESLIAETRTIVRNSGRDSLVRPHAVAYLGRFAQREDFELLQEDFSRSMNDVEKLNVIRAMSKAPKAMRGNFYGRCKHEPELVQWAIECAKSEK